MALGHKGRHREANSTPRLPSVEKKTGGLGEWQGGDTREAEEATQLEAPNHRYSISRHPLFTFSRRVDKKMLPPHPLHSSRVVLTTRARRDSSLPPPKPQHAPMTLPFC